MAFDSKSSLRSLSLPPIARLHRRLGLREQGLLRERGCHIAGCIPEVVGGVEAHSPGLGAGPDDVGGVGNGAGDSAGPQRQRGESSEAGAGGEAELELLTHVHASHEAPSAKVDGLMDRVKGGGMSTGRKGSSVAWSEP